MNTSYSRISENVLFSVLLAVAIGWIAASATAGRTDAAPAAATFATASAASRT